MIGLTGANGQLGRLVVRHLLDAKDGGRIRAVTRNPSHAQAFHDSPPNVEFVRGDFDDDAALEEAFGGLSRLLVISTTDGNVVRIERQSRAITAARKSGVEHIIYLSFLVEDPASPFPFAAAHRETEKVLLASGADWTILRPSLYLDSLGMLRSDLADGDTFYAPAGKGRASFLSRDDIARVASSVLTGVGHQSKTYTLTGAQSVSYAEVADAAANVLGRPIRYADIDEMEYRARAASSVPAAMLDAFVAIWRSIRDQWFDRVSDDVERLTTVEPMSVHAWLVANRSSFGVSPG
ncbi:MAG: SDR family oxidoreductase [Clostridia bacterium]|nr:SDR family oxidoreductase [Deltaproteobacteria bacterium]